MALVSRVSLSGPPDSNPEDFFSASLGVIFPDDVMNQHGDSTHSLTYTSPHLPKPLSLTLCDPTGESDRKLFSHFLWNASLQLAELIEASTLSVPLSTPSPLGPPDVSSWSVRGKSVVELGSGTALPSIMSTLLGASMVCITDYPAPPVLSNLRANLERCHKPEFVPSSGSITPEAFVEGHAWGELDNDFATRHKGKFDRVFTCDCLWMPWQHANLRRSIAHFMSSSPDARAWVVAGFHTGREKMRGFFDADGLRNAGLELERIWERDCDGIEREWTLDRGIEDVSERKRWLVISIIRRVQGG